MTWLPVRGRGVASKGGSHCTPVRTLLPSSRWAAGVALCAQVQQLGGSTSDGSSVAAALAAAAATDGGAAAPPRQQQCRRRRIALLLEALRRAAFGAFARSYDLPTVQGLAPASLPVAPAPAPQGVGRAWTDAWAQQPHLHWLLGHLPHVVASARHQVELLLLLCSGEWRRLVDTLAPVVRGASTFFVYRLRW